MGGISSNRCTVANGYPEKINENWKGQGRDGLMILKPKSKEIERKNRRTEIYERDLKLFISISE